MTYFNTSYNYIRKVIDAVIAEVPTVETLDHDSDYLLMRIVDGIVDNYNVNDGLFEPSDANLIIELYGQSFDAGHVDEAIVSKVVEVFNRMAREVENSDFTVYQMKR